MKSLILTVLALILTACGGPHEEGIYRVVRDPMWNPLDFIGKEQAVTAFSDELLREIARLEDFEVGIFGASWGQMRAMLQQGQANAMLTSIPPTPAFRKIYDFSDIYLHVGPVLVVPVHSGVEDLDGMKDKIVGVLSGSPAMFVAAKIPDIVIQDFMSNPQALEACAQGKIDGVLLEALPAYAYTRDLYQNVLHVVTPPLTNDGLRLVVMKDHHQTLIEEFNAGLKQMRENSDHNKLQEKWGLDLNQGPPPTTAGVHVLEYALHTLHGPAPESEDRADRD